MRDGEGRLLYLEVVEFGKVVKEEKEQEGMSAEKPVEFTVR